MWLILSLLAAVSFGLRGILYHAASRQRLDRSLMLCGVFCTGAVLSLLGVFIYGQTWSLSALTGMMMGFFSYGANACMFKGFAVGKPSLIAILTALPPVVVVFLAYLLWGETLSMWQLLSFVVIVSGILLVRYSNDLSLDNLQGAGWGLLATLCFGMNDVTGKLSTILGADMFPTLFFMFITGTLCFGLSWGIEQRSRAAAASLSVRVQEQPAPASTPQAGRGRIRWTPRNTFLAGLVVGLTNISGMVLILSAFETGITSLVSAVIALNVLIILLYTRIYLRERFTPLELTGMATAFIGIVLLRMF
ncbi:EamA family transporter [Paenibacillus sp. 1P07SE]|uniref:EamA family transporter n=1 Tax=Paenibacillus sp. 1P07SE TaxID=3132209 RepID=UPI0039A67531